MNSDLSSYIEHALDGIRKWESEWGEFSPHPSLDIDPSALREQLTVYLARLEGNYPFFHPRYAGQMLKPPHPAAVVGYLAALLINPNNHALDGGPPTSQMEKEVIQDLRRLFDFPADALGHLTSSGTIANLEALWISRELRPETLTLFSAEAHYTHARMCGVLGMEGRSVAVNQRGEIDLATLEQEIARGGVGTVVLTAGTTGYGVVDDVEAVVRLRQRYDFRIHIDAAYGGFFRVLQGQPLDDAVYRRLLAIRECDSVVVDPHKHGLQPYGCGAVLLRDPRVGRFYRHDSPYTYFTSDELHLGEISLECSRAGAAAGALWLTLKLLPLAAHHGFGPILKATLRAAQRLAAAIEKSKAFVLYREPQLDVVTFYPRADRASEVDALSSALLKHLMRDTDDPVFLSLLKVDASDLTHKGVTADVPEVRILRSVLMKPEHEHVAGSLFGRLTDELNRMRPNGSV